MSLVRAEVEYLNDNQHGVHSDIDGDVTDPAYRAFLHTALDEWLNKGIGSGMFYVAHPVTAAEKLADY